MTKFKPDYEGFIAGLTSGHFRDALACMMGQNSEGIERTRQLLIQFIHLGPGLQTALLDWCREPQGPMQVGDLRWYLVKIARHELAHLVVAKLTGFSPEDLTLVLLSPDGNHMGTSTMNLFCETLTIADTCAYLERRIMVLLAGSIAEAENAGGVRKAALESIYSEGAASDLQKALELIQLHLNIQGNTDSEAMESMLHSMAYRTAEIVETNYETISVLAQRFCDGISNFGQRIGWTASDIKDQPEFANLQPILG